jgi:hypothetical protein
MKRHFGTPQDFDSWTREWLNTAERVRAIAERCLERGHMVSAREAYFRASNYYRAAEFYLHGDPGDPRIVDLSRRARTCFEQALRMDSRAVERIAIPYQDTSSAAAFVSGLGIGAAIVPAMAGAYRGLNKDAVPRATSSIRIFQQLGGSFGIAILAVVLQQQASDRATATANADPSSLAAAFGNTFWWALAFTALALLPTLLLPSRPARTSGAG